MEETYLRNVKEYGLPWLYRFREYKDHLVKMEKMDSKFEVEALI